MACDDESVRPYFTTVPLPDNVDAETALRMVQAEFPDYEIRLLNWQRPKRDSSPLD